ISPLHLLNVKRVAFETAPINAPGAAVRGTNVPASAVSSATPSGDGRWMDAIEARLRDRAGNPPATPSSRPAAPPATPATPEPATSALALPEAEIDALIRR